MKSDLTHYCNSSIPLQKILYFPEKTLTNFPTSSLKQEKRISYISGKLLIKRKIKKKYLYSQETAD